MTISLIIFIHNKIIKQLFPIENNALLWGRKSYANYIVGNKEITIRIDNNLLVQINNVFWLYSSDNTERTSMDIWFVYKNLVYYAFEEKIPATNHFESIKLCNVKLWRTSMK